MSRRHLLACLLIACAGVRPARALLTFANPNPWAPPDQVIVTGTYSFGYDTNVFTRTVAHGAVTQVFTAGATYTRRAGVISVTAATSMGHTWYAGVQGQDFYTPNLNLTLAKGTGRTTGALTLGAAETDAPDPIANNRAVSWSYSGDLTLRYPVNERYYFRNTTDVAATLYTNTLLFSDQHSYNNLAAVNYVLDSKTDLNGEYRFGASSTKGIHALDHGLLVGASGTLLPKLSGTVAAGYDIRSNTYLLHQGPSQTFSSFTANMALNWRFSRSMTFAGTASKEFSISSTDITTNTTTVGVTTNLALGKRLRTDFGVTYVGTTFLGPLSQNRRDTLIEIPVNVGAALTTHIRTNLAYAYMINYSNISTSKFVRETITWSITATY